LVFATVLTVFNSHKYRHSIQSETTLQKHVRYNNDFVVVENNTLLGLLCIQYLESFSTTNKTLTLLSPSSTVLKLSIFIWERMDR